jgi:hypothetical protein
MITRTAIFEGGSRCGASGSHRAADSGRGGAVTLGLMEMLEGRFYHVLSEGNAAQPHTRHGSGHQGGAHDEPATQEPRRHAGRNGQAGAAAAHVARAEPLLTRLSNH